ncbi:uncharacterized protein BDV14DRAFT_33283 [Aspergillus stella-maris]|uniref:uncharacterized protein n=1 Tax=Aspergillus stella-maris TaxID=1810926 RepID=UPI003CCDFA25
MEAAIAVITFLTFFLTLFIYHAQRRQFLNTMDRRRKSATASAVWPPSDNPLSGDWSLVPAMQALRAMVEASLRPHEFERQCSISSPYPLFCERSVYTPRLDPELEELLNSLSSDEVNLLKTFVYSVDGLNHEKWLYCMLTAFGMISPISLNLSSKPMKAKVRRKTSSKLRLMHI